MNKKERFKLILNAKLKLELINDIRNSFAYFDKTANQYIFCNFNFSDVYEYFRKTFELLDIETEKEISFKDSFFRFFGLLQIIYVQQDLIDAVSNIFGVNIENGTKRKINRELRNQLVGHPLSNERNSIKRNRKQTKSENNKNKIKSTIILKDLTSKSFNYISYEPENGEEQYIDRAANIDSILIRHIEFLNESLDSILKKCFVELERQISKHEKYVKIYFNKNVPEITKYVSWFDQYLNYTSFELETIYNCVRKKTEHKRYEVYLMGFKEMVIISYLEMIDRYKAFNRKLYHLNGNTNSFTYDKSVCSKLKKEKRKFENYFFQANNHNISHDLRDISEPNNDLWDIGFKQLNRVFRNDLNVIEELNRLKTLKSNAIEYEICYRYVVYLVGYN